MYEIFRVSAPDFWKRYLKQLMMLKLMLLMSLVFAVSANASPALAQRASIYVVQKPLKEVFKLLKEQTDVDFLFTESQLKNARPVSINVKQEQLKAILDLCFDGQDLSYVLNGNTVIVKKEPKVIAMVNVQRTVTGIVTDEKGTSIPGVNIEVKGTGKRTVTSSEGRYSISIAQNNAVLVFSFMGMGTQEIKVGSGNVINVELKAAASDLGEVVVVGYGTQKKVNLTGAVASIDIAKIADSRPITNVSSMLTGLAPGLYVKSGNADPGGNASLLIRGQGTLNNSAPLVIIDGVEGDISRISPQDISSVSVLKDASSAAIYGSRAANGVLLITTKQGVKGKFAISYDGYATRQSVGHLMPLVDNSVEYMELLNEAAKNSAVAPVFTEANIQKWRDNAGGDPLLWPNTNWADGLFRDVTAINHNVSVSGGTDKLTSFMSFNYANNPGMIENTGFQRYSLRSNTQLQATSWLKVGMNLNGTYSTKDRGSQNLDGMFINSILAVPTVVPRHPDGRFGGTNNSEENSVALSPIFYVNMLKGSNKTNTLVSRFYANINPLEGLNINASYNYNLFDNKITTIPTQNDRWNFQTNTILVPGATALYVQKQDINNVRNFMDFDASYEKTVLGKLNMKLMVGGSQERYVAENLVVTKQGLIDENLTQLNGATGVATATGTLAGDWAMHSYFGRLNLSWDSRYLLELNIRRDGSSRFTPANRWGNFPSASLGWRISEEGFMKQLKDSWLNDLKLRASYGALGNNAVGDYESISVLSSLLYSFNNAPVNGFYQTRFPNLALAWESTYVTNLGLDFSLFSNRLSGNVDAYNKLTKNILISLPAPLVNGTISIPPQNSAEVQNRGIELGLNWKDKIGEFGYFIGTNFTFNSNKVLKFKGSEYALSGTSMIREGLPINTQYVLLVDRIVQTDADVQLIADRIANAPFDPADPETDPTKKRRLNPFPYGKPELGDFLFKDVNGDGIVNDNDRANVGKGSNPQFFYSFTIGANYKGFDFSAMLDGVGGIKTYFQNDYYNPVLRWSRIVNQEIADGRWYPGRPTTATYPRVLLNDNRNIRSSDFWVQDMSFLKIRNIQLGYSLQSNVLSKLKASKIRFYATLENYFTFTRYKGLDPEVSGMAYPNVKQAVFGMNLTF